MFFLSTSLLNNTNAQEDTNISNKWEYKQYSGKINDKYKINMTIIFNQDPNLINGYYSYNGSKNTLKLSGYKEEDQTITIDEYDDKKFTGFFKGVFVGDSFKGDWFNNDSSKKMPFYVTRNYNNKTLIKDINTKKNILGTNNCSLQWVGWDKLGNLKVEEKDQKLIVYGSQIKNSDFLNIDGYFTSIDKNRLEFNGKITTKVSYINSNKPCYREGDMTFLKYDGRNHWRLQEMQNPCDAVTDYVDISIRSKNKR
jgi:hypothetical protein